MKTSKTYKKPNKLNQILICENGIKLASLQMCGSACLAQAAFDLDLFLILGLSDKRPLKWAELQTSGLCGCGCV